jgi:hypothetical protein
MIDVFLKQNIKDRIKLRMITEPISPEILKQAQDSL